LETKLVKVRSAVVEDITTLETKVRSVDAHSVDVAAAGEKCLKDFEGELIKDLVELRGLYMRNMQVIEGLCSLMPENEPSAADYIRWLSAEVVGLPEMFAGVNENFVSATVEGALVMVGDFVDLDALQNVAADGGAGCAKGHAHCFE
jgi:hypothetical protein